MERHFLETENNIVLDAGLFILDKPDAKVILPIVYNEKKEGEVHIVFEDVEPDGEVRIEINSKDDFVELLLYGFSEELGRFTTKPLPIGKLDDKLLSIHIWSALIGTEKSVRKVEYTLFLEK